jgi:hypothetical protein
LQKLEHGQPSVASSPRPLLAEANEKQGRI